MASPHRLDRNGIVPWTLMLVACLGCSGPDEPRGVLIVEPISEAKYYLQNDTQESVRIQAWNHSGEPLALLVEDVPSGVRAHFFTFVEGSGGHLHPSNAFSAFVVTSGPDPGGQVVYSGVVNADWEPCDSGECLLIQ